MMKYENVSEICILFQGIVDKISQGWEKTLHKYDTIGGKYFSLMCKMYVRWVQQTAGVTELLSETKK